MCLAITGAVLILVIAYFVTILQVSDILTTVTNALDENVIIFIGIVLAC